MLDYNEIHSRLPLRLEQLINATKFPIKNLTEGEIKKIFGTHSPIEGVFLITNHKNNKPVYVGRSRHLAQRIGVDLRATSKQQATISYKLTTLKEKYPHLQTIQDARNYMYENYSVQIIKIGDENERLLLQIYAAMELGTVNELNSFRET